MRRGLVQSREGETVVADTSHKEPEAETLITKTQPNELPLAPNVGNVPADVELRGAALLALSQ